MLLNVRSTGSSSGVELVNGMLATQKISSCECSFFPSPMQPIERPVHGLEIPIKVSSLFCECFDRECATLMTGFHQKAATGRLTGVHRKYCSSKFAYTSKCEASRMLLETQPPHQNV